jgi:hypothetical protein
MLAAKPPTLFEEIRPQQARRFARPGDDVVRSEGMVDLVSR